MAESSRRPRRWDDEDTRAPRRTAKKRPAGRPTRRQQGWPELLLAGILAGVGILSLVLIFISPFFFFLTLTVAIGISIFAFVKGCMAASARGSFVAFDYLESLGGVRWFIIIGLFGLYVIGYLILWTVAQVTTATSAPKRFLPWFGLHAVCFVTVLLGFLLAFTVDSARSARDRQAREEAKNEKMAEVPAEQVPVVTGDPELDRALANLEAKNDADRKAAADRLAGMTPNQHRRVVVQKIAEQLRTDQPFDREPLLRALGVWAAAAEVPILIELLDNKDILTRNLTLDALGKLRDERAVKPVVRCFLEFNTRWHAEQALKALGPLAEKEVLALLDQPDKKDLWIPAIYILKDIGTEQSLPALEEASKEFSMKGVAEGAIAAIKKRMRK